MKAPKNMSKAFKAAEKRACKAEHVDGGQVAATLAAIADQIQRPPLVAVVGEFNTGKSTLINRLLDVDVLPTDVVPTTARPACIQYGDRTGVVLNRRSGFEELREIDDLRRYANKGDDAADLLGLADVVSLDVFLPNNTLKKFRLLDTPGISDPEHDTNATLEAVQGADAVIWCTMATQAWKDSEAAFSDLLPVDIRKNSILVITHTDALNTDEEAKRVLRRVQGQTKGEFGCVLMASLVAEHGGKEAGLDAIRDALRQRVVDRADELRAAWASRQALAALVDVLKMERAGYEEAIPIFTEIKAAERGLKRSWATAHAAIDDAFSGAAADFKNLYDKAGKYAQSILKREEFYEPQQICEEGIFTDDYKVEWRTRWFETLDWEQIENQHEMIWKDADTLTDAVIDQIGEAFESFSKKLESKLEPLYWKLDSSMGLAMSFKESLASINQHLFLLVSVITSALHRTFGSIEGGGLYLAAALHEQAKEHKKKFPRGTKLRNHLEMCFSFGVSSEIMQEGGGEKLEKLDEDVKGLLSGAVYLEQLYLDELEAVREELDGIAAALGIAGNIS